MAEKKVPTRMCVVCRGMFEKRRLIRLVAGEDGIWPDISGKKPGRGAYVCPDCAGRLNRGSFKKAFGVVLDGEQLQKLAGELNAER